jgi:dihydroxy-acid dehydratase
MSGTGAGTCILHVAPESAIGGPLALVQDGDLIQLDVPHRRLELLVPQAELTERRARWQEPTPMFTRGYGRLFLDHVMQAQDGADFDFLARGSGIDWAPYWPDGVEPERGQLDSQSTRN